MKKLLPILLSSIFLFSCARRTASELTNSSPIVYSFDDTSQVRHIQGSLAYINKDNSLYLSTQQSWSRLPYARELDLKVSKAGDNITGKTNIIVGTDGYRLGIMKSTGSAQNGNTTLGAPSTYLQIGGGEWNVNSYRMIGFGYLATLADNPPAQIGYQETNKSGSTVGDLVFATRASGTNIAPVIKFRITAAGALKSYGTVTAPEDVATKGYVDTSYLTVKTVTVNGNYSVVGTPSRTLIANNASAASNYTLPPVKLGTTYTFYKIGTSIMTITGPILDAGKTGTKIVSDAQISTTITLVSTASGWLVTGKTGVWTTQ